MRPYRQPDRAPFSPLSSGHARPTDREAIEEAISYVLRRNRPLAERIGAQKQASLDPEMDSATLLARRIIEHLELSGWRLSKPERKRGHSTP